MPHTTTRRDNHHHYHHHHHPNEWRTIALSFVAGAASVSLLWYARDKAAKRRRRQSRNENNDDESVTDNNSHNNNNNHNNNSTTTTNPHGLRHSTSFIDTVKQSVEEAVEDIKSRIGELPSRAAGMTRRRRWPWETIHKNAAAKKKNTTNTSPTSSGSTIKLTPSEPAVRENPELCIGSIFGLDVGGTLAKLVYFEQRPDDHVDHHSSFVFDNHNYNVRERYFHRAASAQAVLKARRGHDFDPTTSSSDDGTMDGHHHRRHHHHHHQHHRSSLSSLEQPLRERSFSVGLLRRKLTTTSSAELRTPITTATTATATATATTNEKNSDVQQQQQQQHREFHPADSNDDLENLYKLRQESVPHDLHAYATEVHCNDDDLPPHKHDNNNNNNSNDDKSNDDNNNLPQECQDDMQHKKKSTCPQRSTSTGTTGLKKSRSMFDLSMSQKSRDHAEALDRFYHFARKLDTYREGVKDHKLSFYSRALGGEFHFIRFETRRMENAMELIRANDLHLTIREMGATGGGAHKYAADWERLLGIQMKKQEELDSLVAGMQFVLSTVVGECYTFRPAAPSAKANDPDPTNASSSINSMNVDAPSSTTGAEGEEEKKSPSPLPSEPCSSSDESENDEDDRDCRGTDEWWWSRKVQRDSISYSSTYPYLLVTIGTGVSILRVDGPRQHERISGSTIGGGTYWGLIRLLTDLEDFEDVMRLAEHGDPSKVDMLVGDIYGNNKEALEKLGLPASLVASSFGKLVAREDPAAGLKQEDLARALLLMVTNNIGQVAYLNAQLHKTPRIYFVGNFLRGNKLSQRRLSFAINYWSKGEMEALFLEHEGYFGALGAFLLSQDISLDDLEPSQRRKTKPSKKENEKDEFHHQSISQHRRSHTLEEHHLVL